MLLHKNYKNSRVLFALNRFRFMSLELVPYFRTSRLTHIGFVDPEVKKELYPYSWPKTTVKCIHHRKLLALDVFV